MSAGHDVSAWATADEAKARRALEHPAVQSYLNRMKRVDREHDLPYLAGYSEDGSTIYIDRHLPEELEAVWEARSRLFRPDYFLQLHEDTEKALIDALGWIYQQAHSVANRVELRAVLSAGIFLQPYKRALDPFIKADQHEKLVKVPADLDMTPYYAQPVNRGLIDRMRKAMGKGKQDKNDPDINYSPTRGKPKRHCGPDRDWPEGYCSMYREHSCTAVAGEIEPKGGCNIWEAAE